MVLGRASRHLGFVDLLATRVDIYRSCWHTSPALVCLLLSQGEISASGTSSCQSFEFWPSVAVENERMFLVNFRKLLEANSKHRKVQGRSERELQTPEMSHHLFSDACRLSMRNIMHEACPLQPPACKLPASSDANGYLVGAVRPWRPPPVHRRFLVPSHVRPAGQSFRITGRTLGSWRSAQTGDDVWDAITQAVF